MTPPNPKWLLPLLNHVSVALVAVVFVVFGVLAPQFLALQNVLNIAVQASSTAIVAIGMTFVLLTAGVDLSVGAIMFVSAAIAGKLLGSGLPLPAALLLMLVIGMGCGALNALFITRLKIAAFVVTLATLNLGNGCALWITNTRDVKMPDALLTLGSAKVAGVPAPILVLAGVLVAAHVILTRTPFGRQIYAVGFNLETARKAGIPTTRTLSAVYVISGLCAAIGAIVSLSQLGTVSPTFGRQKEFSAIAAAVLGGTSLFGGRGNVFPGTLLGAVLIQTVESGLVIAKADPYLHPLITSAIIFAAVLIDSLRSQMAARLSRRKIRPLEA